jgi:UDP-glucose 4-epimerase
MNVLVTGGAGFIGSQIAKTYRKKGDRVWIVDNFSTGRAENLDENFFRCDSADMRLYSHLSEALNWADLVYHMAATVGQKVVLADPEATLLNNIQCCEVLLEKAYQHNRILIASSASVYWYGVSGDQILKEDSILKIPSGKARQQAYGLSKLICEVLSQASHCNTVIARLFNIYGPNQRSDYGSVVSTWVEQCLSNKPLTIHGNGNQLRSFCYVEDAVRAMGLLLEKNSQKGEIYNIGNENLISLSALSGLVKKVTHSRSELIYVSYQDAYGFDFTEAENIPPSFEKIQKLTGFRSQCSLEEGLTKIAK